MAKVVKETKESHVQIFGDTSFASDFAGSFEGDAQDKHGYLRGDVKAQVRKGVDARALTGQISQAGSTRELLRLSATHNPSLDPIHVANLWNKLGKQSDASGPSHRDRRTRHGLCTD